MVVWAPPDPSHHVPGFTWTDAISAEKVFIKDESGLNWVAAGIRLDSKLHLHVCLCTARECTCEQASLPVCCSRRHTLAPLLRLPQTRPPLPPSSSNYGDHKYAGGQTADTPGSPAPTLCLALFPRRPCHISSRSVASPSSLLSWTVWLTDHFRSFSLPTLEPKYSCYGLDYPQTDRWLFAAGFFYELFGGQWEARRSFDL